MTRNLRSLLSRIPLVGRLAGGKKGFTNSADYWERRYRRGRDSGAGSYGRLAEFKAQVINGFVRDNDVESVIEFGCGDGNQLALADYGSYVGLDVSDAAISQCRERFKGDPTKTFHHHAPNGPTQGAPAFRADLALSLDVIYHLVEDDVYERYMRDLFDAGIRFVIVYSSDYEKASDTPHIKYRKFTDFVETRFSGWTLKQTVKNKYSFEEFGPEEGSISDFYIYEKVVV